MKGSLPPPTQGPYLSNPQNFNFIKRHILIRLEVQLHRLWVQ